MHDPVKTSARDWASLLCRFVANRTLYINYVHQPEMHRYLDMEVQEENGNTDYTRER